MKRPVLLLMALACAVLTGCAGTPVEFAISYQDFEARVKLYPGKSKGKPVTAQK